MMSSRIARRYARAFFLEAREADRIPAVQADFRGLAELIRGFPALRGFLGDYALPREARRRALSSLFESRLDPLTWKFLRFLESKRRLAAIDDIAQVIAAYADAERGVVKAAMTAACPLDDNQRASLAERVGRRLGAPVELAVAVDARLLGGFRFQIGDRLFDYSLRGALDGLRVRLAGTSVGKTEALRQP